MDPLKTQAIKVALTGDWKTAVLLNQQLVEQNPNDIEALNRLAFAFSVLGKNDDAKNIYQKVLKIDDKNPIALKNLQKLSGCSKKNPKQNLAKILNSDVEAMFIEEGGKTKVIDLINVAEPKIISSLITGEAVELRIKRLKIFVLDANEKYIGMLPMDIGKRLLRFMKSGNEYQSYVKSLENRKISIFVRETKRIARFKNEPSFALAGKTKGFILKPEDQEEEES